jgi:hypothetical protein
LDQICSIAAIRTEADIETGEDGLLAGIKAMVKDVNMENWTDTSRKIGEDKYLSYTIDVELTDSSNFNEALPLYGDNDDDLPIIGQIKSGMAPTSKGSQYTRRQLKMLPEWDQWRNAEWAQLDEMVRCNMFGKVVMRWEIEGEFDVIRIVWSYNKKLFTGKLKARFCGNGKPLKPKTKMEQKTFTACTSHTGMRIVFAIAAYEGRLLYAADAINAFAQSGPLEKPCYVVVDEAFREWYYERNKIMLPLNALIELTSSIQGHPDAGGNWQAKCNTTLKNLGWDRLVHEPCLYRRGKDVEDDVIMCRQIDDKLFAVYEHQHFIEIVEELKGHMNIEGEKELCTGYNGCEIDQRNEYIAIRVQKYILASVDTYGWSQENYSKTPKAPLSETLAKEIAEAGKGPPTRTPEGILIQNEM